MLRVEVHLHVDDASYHTPDLAIVQMHPTDIAVDASRRVVGNPSESEMARIVGDSR